MRGAASSFGITTSITVKTFAAPSFAKVFTYDYQMTTSQASSAMAAFQSFVQTNIPAELGMEINMGKGNTRGSISFSLAGAWYGAQGSALNNTLAPLLAQLPKPQSVSFTGNGTYIDSVRVLSGTPLNTSSGPDETDTFYAKSLITPSGQPMTAAAISAYINYLATTGFDSSTVSCIVVYCLSLNSDCIRRAGSLRSNSTAALIPRSTLFLLIRPPSSNVTRFSRSNSTPHPPTFNLPIPALASLSSMVRFFLRTSAVI
jgi:hypothetical protein